MLIRVGVCVVIHLYDQFHFNLFAFPVIVISHADISAKDGGLAKFKNDVSESFVLAWPKPLPLV